MGYRRPGRESESKGQGSLRGKWSRDVYRIFYWRVRQLGDQNPSDVFISYRSSETSLNRTIQVGL